MGVFRWLLLSLLPALQAADWQPWGPYGGSVVSITVDPSEPAQVLAGARNGQLFRSEDRGATWRQLSFGRHLSGSIRVVAIDPSVRGHYWAGVSAEQLTSNGLWESRDSGQSWTQHLPGLAVESLALFPASPATIAVGTRHGLYLTTDGEQWNRITPERHPDLEDIVSLAFDPTDARVLYAGTPHLPWKTIDGGRTWTAIHAGMLDDSDVFSIHVSAARPDKVFASACSGIYRSLDAGGRWKLLQGIPNSSRRTHVIVQHPSRADTIFAGTTAGLFRSTDGGERWVQLNQLQINAIAFDPLRPDAVLLATEYAGVQISLNLGKTIQPSNEGLHARNVVATAALGSLQYLSTAYEGSAGGVFVHSGAGWRKIGATTFSSTNVQSLAASAGGLFAGTDERVLQSKNGGRTWTRLPRQPPGRGLKIAFVGADLWAGSNIGLFRWTGTAWQKGATTSSPVRGIRASGRDVVAWTNSAALVSSDAGKSWRMIATAGVFAAAVSCQGMALVATSEGLLVAENGGAPVAAIGIPAGTVSAVAFHRLLCQRAYAAQFGRLYQSNDGGLHWEVVEGARSLPDVVDLRTSVSGEDLLFATVPGSGVFRIDMDR